MHHLTLQFQIRTIIMDKSKFAFQICAFTSGAKQSYVEILRQDQKYCNSILLYSKCHIHQSASQKIDLNLSAMSNLDNNTQISKKYYVLCNDNNIIDPFCSLSSISTKNRIQYYMCAYATQITNLFTSRKQKMQNTLNNFDDFLPIN